MDNFTITWKDREVSETEGQVTDIRINDTHVELVRGVAHKEYRDHFQNTNIKELPFKRWIIPWSEVAYISTS